MDRRKALGGISAITLAAMADSAMAEGHKHDHEHHMQQAAKYQALIEAAADCAQKGQACNAHCNILLGQGEKEMAACQASANQTIAVCSALQQLANLNSTHLAKLAAVAMDVCKECEDECRKHEQKHMACKECGDACAACYKQCKALSV